jgi:hypothetical protein
VAACAARGELDGVEIEERQALYRPDQADA